MHEILIENKEIMSNFGIIPIDTNFIRPKYNASHLICHDSKAAFVDVGTSKNIESLENALRMNLRRQVALKPKVYLKPTKRLRVGEKSSKIEAVGYLQSA